MGRVESIPPEQAGQGTSQFSERARVRHPSNGAIRFQGKPWCPWIKPSNDTRVSRAGRTKGGDSSSQKACTTSPDSLFEYPLARDRRPIASVPNAESPDGLRCVYADITHELAFTPVSFEEMLFCHDLKLVELRDPWPAPVGTMRRLYRSLVKGARSLESLRLRSLGLEPPRIWSNVMWGLARRESFVEPSTSVPG